MAASYNHTQSIASDTWTISHNLNSSAVVINTYIDVSGHLEEIWPLETEHYDDNTIIVRFTNPQTGRSRIAI